MRHPTLIPLGVLGSLVCACDPGSDVEAVGPSVRDSAGIQIVSNASTGALGELVVRESLRLGVVDGDGPEQFFHIQAVVMDDVGHLYVGNDGSASVRVFDRDGTFLVEFGRRGEGPSELTSIDDVFLAGDTVAVVDERGRGKVVLFRKDGTFVGNWTARQPDGSWAMPAHRGSSGWLAMGRSPRFPRLAPGEAWRVTRPVLRIDLGSSSVEELVYEVPIQIWYGLSTPEMGLDVSLLPETWAMGLDRAGRLYLTDHRIYRIDVFEPTGLVRSVRREFTPRPFTSTDVDDIRAAALHMVDTTSRTPVRSRAEIRRYFVGRWEQQAKLPAPNIVPPLGRLLVSPDGSFWVERADLRPLEEGFLATLTAPIVPGEETTWDLFSSDGAYVGSAILPARFRAEAVAGMTVVGVWADELDVQYVIRLDASGAD